MCTNRSKTRTITLTRYNIRKRGRDLVFDIGESNGKVARQRRSNNGCMVRIGTNLGADGVICLDRLTTLQRPESPASNFFKKNHLSNGIVE